MQLADGVEVPGGHRPADHVHVVIVAVASSHLAAVTGWPGERQDRRRARHRLRRLGLDLPGHPVRGGGLPAAAVGRPAVPDRGAAPARLPGGAPGPVGAAGDPDPDRPPRRCPASCSWPAATAWSAWPSSGSQSGLVALLIACTPLWIVVLRTLLRDRPAPATAIGVLVGLAGVALIFLPGGSAGRHRRAVRGAVRAGRAVLGGRLAAGHAAAGAGRPADADHGGDGRGRRGAAGGVGGAGRAGRVLLRRRVRVGLAGAGVPGRVRVAGRLHRVRVAARQRPGLAGGHLRVREPGRRGAARGAVRGGAADRVGAGRRPGRAGRGRRWW